MRKDRRKRSEWTVCIVAALAIPIAYGAAYLLLLRPKLHRYTHHGETYEVREREYAFGSPNFWDPVFRPARRIDRWLRPEQTWTIREVEVETNSN